MSISGFDAVIRSAQPPSPDAMRKATLEVFTDYHARIFENGMASNGDGIGSYSTEAIYVSVDASPKKFPPKGKTGKTKFKNGNSHKSGYFQGGYREFKGAIGRESGFVNLQLTENLKRNTVPNVEAGQYQFGFTSELEAKKASGNEDHFSVNIFDPTQAEIDKFVELLIKYSDI